MIFQDLGNMVFRAVMFLFDNQPLGEIVENKYLLKFWIFKEIYGAVLYIRQEHKNMSWCYIKSINWGDTNDYIANFGNSFLYWDKILEDTIHNNFQKFRMFSRKISLKLIKRSSHENK